jgi:peptide alpha-N-acetyltransferase
MTTFAIPHRLENNSGMYHEMTWPQISFVAEDNQSRIVGYVLAKMFALQ